MTLQFEMTFYLQLVTNEIISNPIQRQNMVVGSAFPKYIDEEIDR